MVSPTDPELKWPDGYVAVLQDMEVQEKVIPFYVGLVRRFFAWFPGRHRRCLGLA